MIGDVNPRIGVVETKKDGGQDAQGKPYEGRRVRRRQDRGFEIQRLEVPGTVANPDRIWAVFVGSALQRVRAGSTFSPANVRRLVDKQLASP